MSVHVHSVTTLSRDSYKASLLFVELAGTKNNNFTPFAYKLYRVIALRELSVLNLNCTIPDLYY